MIDSRDTTDLGGECGDHGTQNGLGDGCPGCKQERVAAIAEYGCVDDLEPCEICFNVEDKE